jgi:hypothetical protein
MAACKSAPAATPLHWDTVAPGIEHAAFSVTSSSPAFSGHAFSVDLEKNVVRVVAAGAPGDRRTVDVIAGALPVHLATNASFFDEANKAMGRVVDLGALIGADKRAAWGALVVEGHRARVVPGDALPADKPGGDAVVQGVPRLVVSGEVPRLKPAVAERTAVCAQAGKLVVVVAEKADTTDFARFLALPKERGGLGCIDALNLDGGPSTQMEAALPGLKTSVKGGWGVPNALVVVPKPAAPTQPSP